MIYHLKNGVQVVYQRLTWTWLKSWPFGDDFQWRHAGYLVAGIPTPLKMMDFVNWDDDIPNWMQSHEIPWFRTTNQLCYSATYSSKPYT